MKAADAFEGLLPDELHITQVHEGKTRNGRREQPGNVQGRGARYAGGPCNHFVQRTTLEIAQAREVRVFSVGPHDPIVGDVTEWRIRMVRSPLETEKIRTREEGPK